MKALGIFVFAGSMSIGVQKAGFDIDRVLEITDEMRYQNAAHFAYNYPGIPIVDPSVWQNLEYMMSLPKYDLIYR